MAEARRKLHGKTEIWGLRCEFYGALIATATQWMH
jgi:hypothetical protein